MRKAEKKELSPALERGLLAFHKLRAEVDGPPANYKNLGKAIKRHESVARYALERLEKLGLVKKIADRYAPYRMTPAGLKLAKSLTKKAAR